MANMELIDTKTAGSGGASYLEFTSIPSTYTDLMCVVSLKSDVSGGYTRIELTFNGSTTGYSERFMYGIDGNATSGDASSNSKIEYIWIPATRSEAVSTFGNCNIYIPNYAVAQSKSVSTDFVTEGNISTSVLDGFNAGLWANNATISSLKITSNSGLFVQYSTAYLYGISNVTSGSKATGGIVSSDGTYWYHMFPYSGTFTPTTALTADYLVIAGGGGGSYAGGGAGGLRSTVGATGGGGSLESALSLTAQAYTVTVGAGGAAGSAGNSYIGQNGSNSVFSTITSTGGGGAAYTAPAIGGSGGGRGDTGAGAAATSSPVQGYAGGAGISGGVATGGGGGAGAVGAAGATSPNRGGNGGNGVQITAFANATQTGVNNGYYAGGGGGGYDNTNYSSGVGGLGGGGNGTRDVKASAGVANTGGGGAGSYASGADFSNGGSGLVIIRYAI